MKDIVNSGMVSILLILLASSCAKNDETEILSYQLVGKQSAVAIDIVKKELTVTFPESITSAYPVAANFSLSDGATAYVSNNLQKSGVTCNNYEVPFTYHIKAENGKSSIDWNIVSANNSVTLKWGLGGFQTQSNSTDRKYDWYFDQKNTGTYASANCGPTATTIAAKWSDPVFSKTPEDARAAYRPTGGWWYTDDIHKYLIDNNIPHRFVPLPVNISSTQYILKEKLDSGKILIICVDMDKIRNGPTDDRRIDKFYSTSPGWGHFLVVKGYRKVNGEFFYENYDPNSWGAMYSSGELKGSGRYYRTEDVYNAISDWWNFAIVISQKGAKSENIQIQDISGIPVKWGR